MFFVFTATMKREIQYLWDKHKYPAGQTVIKTALDKLTPPVVLREDDDSDSSGNGTRFAKRTGIFELDFPSDNTKPKQKGERKRSSNKRPRLDAAALNDQPKSPLGSSSDHNDSNTSIGSGSGALFTSDISSKESSDVIPVKPQNKRLIKKGKTSNFRSFDNFCVQYFICIYFNIGIRRLSSTCPVTIPDESTDDSDFDGQRTAIVRNRFGEVKTSHYNRPKQDKAALRDREKLPTRQSKRITNIAKEKAAMEKVMYIIVYSSQ